MSTDEISAALGEIRHLLATMVAQLADLDARMSGLETRIKQRPEMIAVYGNGGSYDRAQ